MNAKSAKYYEQIGDKLATEKRLEEALRAYNHAEDDTMSGAPDLDAYKRINAKKLAVLFSQFIKATGLKKAAIAARCGVTPTTISRYCSGKSVIPPLVWREVERMAYAVK